MQEVAVVQERGGRLRLTGVKSRLLQASELPLDGSSECSSGRSLAKMLSKKSVVVVYKMN